MPWNNSTIAPINLAQTLATKVSNTVGVVTNGLTDSQLGQMLRQLDAVLWGQGRSFILANGVEGSTSLADKLAFLASATAMRFCC